MDNEMMDNYEEMMVDEQLPSSDDPENNNIGLIWRVAIGVVALTFIAYLGYPFIQEQFKRNSNDDPNLPPEAQATAAALEATAEAHPDSVEAWFNLGKAYYKAEQWEQAIESFQKATELNPTHQASFANLGAAYHRQDELDLAAAQYEKALELKPDDGEVVYNLAAVYIQKATQTGGQPDPDLLNQALAQLHHALELSPDSAEPYFGLGVVYLALNQREESIQAFETFLARDTSEDSRAIQEAQRYLQILRGK